MSMCRDFLARCSSFLSGNMNMQPILKEVPWQYKVTMCKAGRCIHIVAFISLQTTNAP